MTVHPLTSALVSLGIEARVDARESLAVITVPNGDAASRLRHASLRRAVIALAKAHGFGTVAVELENAADDRAPVSGH